MDVIMKFGLVTIIVVIVADFVLRNKRYKDSQTQKKQTYKQIKEEIKAEVKSEIKAEILSDVKTDIIKFQTDMLCMVDKK